MKKVYEAENYVEAHMIVHALEEDGIESFVKEDREPLNKPTVWIQDDDHYAQAMKTIGKINETDHGVQKSIKPLEKKSSRFGLGFLIGSFFGFLIFILIFKPDSILKKNETQWDLNKDGVIDVWREIKSDGVIIDIFDTNFDGKPDTWIYYKQGKKEKVIYDMNFDGNPDTWEFYNEKELLERAELDTDFDGKVDGWLNYKDGSLVKDAYDDDFDGRPDNWGIYEKSRLVERSWSFKNDGVIDKKVIYKRGRRVEEFYDLNRDGKFDQRVILDEFERIVRRENL